MDKSEFSKFAMAMRTYYPQQNLLPNAQSMELWFFELQDLPFDIATAALRKWVETNRFAPTIADLRSEANVVVNGHQKTWQDGWDSVMTAVARFGFYDPKGAMKFLEETDPAAASVVNRMGFRNICMSENVTADRAAFRTCYEVMQKREMEDKTISLPLRDMINQIQEKTSQGLKDHISASNLLKGFDE